MMLNRPAVFLAFTLFVVLGWESVDAAERNAAIIPEPVETVTGSGVFEISAGTIVVAEGAATPEAKLLVDYLAPAMGFRLAVQSGSEARDGAIALLLGEQQGEPGGDAYRLSVTPRRIAIRAEKPAGLFYGMQTLRQLLPPVIFGAKAVADVPWIVPCLEIADHPRLGWRGLLIDPARHFIPKPDVLRFIDLMALHKLNRLQIHLTDNHGWRIEIKKYPLLTEIGSRMNFTRYRDRDAGGPTGEFYTQEDIREIVDYARQRHITVVPEIEMPAHSGAAIVAYPELGLNTKQVRSLPPEERWWKSKQIIAPRPEAIAMLQEILAEVAQLFPGRYVHIGGDEANLGFWSDSQEMQNLRDRQGLEDMHQLHSWFLKQMDAFLTEQGRRLVGWDEILQGGLAPGATVMSWRGEQGGITAARAGHDVVMAPTSHTYFDYYQGPRDQEPRAIGGFIPLEKVYHYEPIPEELSQQQAAHVLGAQAQLWAEYIPNPRHLDYMAYPRAAAFCEVVWSPREKLDFQDFLDRLQRHLQRLDVLRVNYRPLDPPVPQVPKSTDASTNSRLKHLRTASNGRR